MRLLVTGAGGRIGHRLVEKLIDSSLKVRVLARREKPHLQKADDIIICNLLPDSDFSTLMEDVDTLIHLADGFNAYEHLPLDHQSKEAQVRLITLKRMAQAAAEKRVRFIYLSTIKTMCGTYTNEILTEETEAKPQSLYGHLKLSGEQAITKMAAQHGSSAIVLRFPIVFGDNIGGNMEQLATLANTPCPLPFSGLKNKRSLISADSLIDAVLAVIYSDIEGQNTFLLQDGSLTVEELISLIRKALERPVRIFPLPDLVWLFLQTLPIIGPKAQRLTKPLQLDDSKFRECFNWQPNLDIGNRFVAEYNLRPLLKK